MIINELTPDMIKSLQIATKFYGHKLKLIIRSLEFLYQVKIGVDVVKSYINSLSHNERRLYQEKDNQEKRFILNLAKKYYFQPETLLSKYHEEYDRDYIRRQDIRLLLMSTFNFIMVLVYDKKDQLLKDDVYDFIFIFMSWPILSEADICLKNILWDLFDIADYYLQFNNKKQTKLTRQQIISTFQQDKLQTIIKSMIYIDNTIDIQKQENTNQMILEEGYTQFIKSKIQYSYFEQLIVRYFKIINNNPFNQQDQRIHLQRYISDRPYEYSEQFFNELDEDQSFQIFYNIFINQINLNSKRNLQLSPLRLRQNKLGYLKLNNLKKLINDANYLQLQNQFVREVYNSFMNSEQQIDKKKLKVTLELYLDL